MRAHRVLASIFIAVAIAIGGLRNPDDATAAVKVIAKFPTYAALPTSIEDVVSLTNSTIGVRADGRRRARFVRIGKDGRVRTIISARVKPYSWPQATWAASQRGAVALLSDLIHVENSEPWVEQRRQFVVTDRGGATRVRGIPAGGVAARGNRVAALRWIGDLPVAYVIYDVSNKRPRLIASGSVPGPPSLAKKRSRYDAGQFKIALLGNQLAVAQSGTITVFNWKRRAVIESFPAAIGDVDAVALTGDSVVAQTRFTAGGRTQSSELVGYARPSGSVRWRRSTVNESLEIVDGAARLMQRSSTTSPDITAVDPQTGVDKKLGTVPSFVQGPSNELRLGGLSTSKDRVTWVENDCYWQRILTKPLAESASRSRPNCDYSYVRGSMQLSGRKLSLRIRSKHGMPVAEADVMIAGNKFVVAQVAAAPGTRRIFLSLGRSAIARLRANQNQPVAVVFTQYDHPARTFTDRVRLR